MRMMIELEVDNASEAFRVLRTLANDIRDREAGEGDAIERKVLRSGIYELSQKEVISVDIL